MYTCIHTNKLPLRTIGRQTNEEQKLLICIARINVWISINKTRRIPSKDSNHVPWLVSDVFVDCEDEHEHEEEAGAAEEVPDVVPGIDDWSVFFLDKKSTKLDFDNKLTRRST